MKDMDTVGALPGLGSMENHTPACRSSQKEPCTCLCGLDVLPRTSYSAAVALLCELEEQYHPQERYTLRSPDGHPMPRRGIELVLSRLYNYEREIV